VLRGGNSLKQAGTSGIPVTPFFGSVAQHFAEMADKPSKSIAGPKLLYREGVNDQTVQALVDSTLQKR
jgi:hypothetical protein